jgi:stage II sporulation protein R
MKNTGRDFIMHKRILGIIIILGGIFSVGLAVANQGEPLAQSVLRLHVIANSDNPADQALKIAVKDEIVAMMKQEFTDVKDAEEAREMAQQEIPLIKAVAQAKIKANGYNYPVEVYVGEYDFPTKSYGNMVFPSGKYQAVRVVIGEGQGKNWWCVLFPPLCLVSSTDQGLSLSSPQQAQITFKCLELLPKGVKLGKDQ